MPELPAIGQVFALTGGASLGVGRCRDGAAGELFDERRTGVRDPADVALEFFVASREPDHAR